MTIQATAQRHMSSRRTRSGRLHGARVPAAAVVFLSLFATQAGLMALSPVLAQVAGDFGVSTADAGQLRTVAGLVAGVTALAVALLGCRAGLRSLLAAGLVLLAVGSLSSVLAPTLAILALGQAATGAAAAMLIAAGTAAAGEWALPDQRSRLLSWALIGQAAAWVVGMPVIGVLGDASWRYALALPLAATLVALLALGRGPVASPSVPACGGMRTILENRVVRSWALGELLAFSAWAGTLVYAGALFVESYDVSLTVVGAALAAGGAGYLAGNFLVRRWVDGHARTLLIGLGIAFAVSIALFGGMRAGFWQSAAVFALLGVLGGGRTFAGSAFALSAAPEQKLTVMSIRAAATQFGYLLGAGLGGAALALGGYEALGGTLAALFLAGVAPHVLAIARDRRRRPARPGAARRHRVALGRG